MNTNHLYPLIFDAVRDALLVVDDSGAVLLANAAAHAAFHIPGQRTLREMTPIDASWSFDAREIATLIEAGSAVGGHVIEGGEPGTRPVVVDLDPIPGHAVRSWLLRVRPASAERGGEFWRDEMISLVSHEIKNPLSAMKNSVELLLSQAPGELTEGQKRFLDTSGRSIDRLSHLVDDFLDVSRIRAGAFDVSPRSIDVRAFIDDTIRTFRTLFNVTRVSLEWDTDMDLTDAHIDPARLEQVLFNLLSNALKFTPENGTITVRATTAGIEALDDSLRLLPWSEMGRPRILEIQVRDSGIGMSGETLETVFDRFQSGQGEGATDGAGGAHLGLNISRTLLEAQGGWLEITSELGIGTAVTVRLPQDRQTRTTLSRLGLVERLLRRCRENRRLAEVYVFGKFSDDNWDDIAASWRERVTVNPLDDNADTALRIWTLTSEMAVGVLVDPPRDSVEHTLAPSFVVCEDNAYMFPSYAVGVALARRDGESSTRLIGVATSRMLRARELMARATIEAMDSGIEYITREWTDET